MPPRSMTGKGQALIVYKLDSSGREVWQYPAIVLERGPRHIRLEAFFNRDDMRLGYAVFRRGDRFVETFYSDRWYNIFAVYDRESDALKGWYCNVCRPAEIGETSVRCDDLALDVWVAPGGDPLILDEDEFAALSLTPEERRHARHALDQLLQDAKDGRLPQ